MGSTPPPRVDEAHATDLANKAKAFEADIRAAWRGIALNERNRPMPNASLATIADCLVNAGKAIAERLRQEGTGASPPFTSCEEHFDAEIECLRRHGQDELADALAPLRDGGASDNG